MICKRCGKHIPTLSGYCRLCTTIIDLEKAGYTDGEIQALLELLTE